MADAQGRVIGINSAIAGGLALAVPSNAVERFPRLGSEERPGVTKEQGGYLPLLDVRRKRMSCVVRLKGGGQTGVEAA